jgi:hypothetical protein
MPRPGSPQLHAARGESRRPDNGRAIGTGAVAHPAAARVPGSALLPRVRPPCSGRLHSLRVRRLSCGTATRVGSRHRLPEAPGRGRSREGRSSRGVAWQGRERRRELPGVGHRYRIDRSHPAPQAAYPRDWSLGRDGCKGALCLRILPAHTILSRSPLPWRDRRA